MCGGVHRSSENDPLEITFHKFIIFMNPLWGVGGQGNVNFNLKCKKVGFILRNKNSVDRGAFHIQRFNWKSLTGAQRILK